MKINKAIADTLNKIDAMIVRHREWNEESQALGLIPDEDKLRMLKRDLYSEVRLSNPNQQKILNITSAIQTLEEIRHAEFERKQSEIKQRLSLPSQVEATCTLLILLAITVVAGSFLASYKCGDYPSQFCSNARIVSTQITRFYYNYFFR